ncbi:fimbrial protein [Yersinia kristensenii]|uniref:fimbrial protein n=1 Tax=Yersinia kristensenii TaxID=28152 RepID=UPI0011AA0EE4|nr:type 1 fimbrial protein [Yersinia kristensenii]
MSRDYYRRKVLQLLALIFFSLGVVQDVAAALTRTLQRSATVVVRANIIMNSCQINQGKGIDSTINLGSYSARDLANAPQVRVPLEIDCSDDLGALNRVQVSLTPVTGQWNRDGQLKLQTTQQQQDIQSYYLQLMKNDATAIPFSPEYVEISDSAHTGRVDASFLAQVKPRPGTILSAGDFGRFTGAVSITITYH